MQHIFLNGDLITHAKGNNWRQPKAALMEIKYENRLSRVGKEQSGHSIFGFQRCPHKDKKVCF